MKMISLIVIISHALVDVSNYITSNLDNGEYGDFLKSYISIRSQFIWLNNNRKREHSKYKIE